VRLAKRHPEWQLNRLEELRVSSGVYDGQRVTFLYRQASRVLLLLFSEAAMEEVESDKDSTPKKDRENKEKEQS
jgi:hypothetical protein